MGETAVASQAGEASVSGAGVGKMEIQVIEIEGTWEEIAEHAPRFAGRRLRLTVLPEESQGTTATQTSRSLGEEIADIVASVPEAEWEKLPSDLGDNLDHYIYGTPKRE
jgi:hypothetical protein